MRDFFHQVWDLVRRIPPGQAATYGQIAEVLGVPRAARMVDWALHALPPSSDVPWHRVANRERQISTPRHPQGHGTQHRLLERKGSQFDAQGRIDLSTYGWDGFPPGLMEETEDV